MGVFRCSRGCVTMPDELKNAKKVVGVKQLTKALRQGTVQTVFLAKNADPMLTEPVEALAEAHRVPVRWVSTMAELGQHCGISVGAAAAGILN